VVACRRGCQHRYMTENSHVAFTDRVSWDSPVRIEISGPTFSKLLRKILGRFLIIGKYLAKHQARISK